MAFNRVTSLLLQRTKAIVANVQLKNNNSKGKIVDEGRIATRMAATTRSGAILPEPKTTPFGFLGVVAGVVIGLFIGAAISKNVANFLEENDLFVPSDDDDDDD